MTNIKLINQEYSANLSSTATPSLHGSAVALNLHAWAHGLHERLVRADKSTKKGHTATRTSWAASSTHVKNIKEVVRLDTPGDLTRLFKNTFRGT